MAPVVGDLVHQITPNDGETEGLKNESSHYRLAFLEGKKLTIEETSFGPVSKLPLNEVIDNAVRTNLSGDTLLLDVLLRISQEMKLKQGTDPLSADVIDALRRDIFRTAEDISEKLTKEEKLQKRPLTYTEIAETINSVFFKDGEFKKANEWEFFETAIGKPGRTFEKAWLEKEGVCEDLVGCYMSVVDLLNRKGHKLPISAIMLPGHILVRVGGVHGGIYVELTDQGDLRTKSDYVKKYKLGPKAQDLYLKGSALNALAAELKNCSATIEDNDAKLEFVKYAEKCNPSDPNTALFIALEYIDRFEEVSGEGKRTLLKDTWARLNRVIKLDPEGREPYAVRATLCMVAAEDSYLAPTEEKKIYFYDKALAEIESALKLEERTSGNPFDRSTNIQLNLQKAKFLQRMFEITKDNTYLNSEIEVFDEIIKSDSKLRVSMHSWKGEAYRKGFEITGNEKYLQLAYDAFDYCVKNAEFDFLKKSALEQQAEIIRLQESAINNVR